MVVLLFVWLVSFLQVLFPTNLEVSRFLVRVPYLKCGSLRVVHISDIHYDFFEPQRISEHMLNEVIQISNENKPDLVLITGDFVEYNAIAAQELSQKWLSRLMSTYGTYAVLGNHDYKEGEKGRDIIMNALSSVGIVVLNNAHVNPILNDPSFELVGVGDSSSRKYGINDYRVQDAFANVSKFENEVTRIVLAHQPDTAKKLTGYKVDLQLSGHVHGGQIRVPWTGRPLLYYIKQLYLMSPNFLKRFYPGQIFVVSNWLWSEGLHTIPRTNANDKNNFLFVNRGLATHPPFRLFCPGEIAVIDIKSS